MNVHLTEIKGEQKSNDLHHYNADIQHPMSLDLPLSDCSFKMDAFHYIYICLNNKNFGFEKIALISKVW